MKNTTTRNGDSKNYHLSPEEAQERFEQTDKCTVIVTAQTEVGKECSIDVMAAQIKTPTKVKDGIRPENQGDSINPQYAAEFNGNGVVIVTDMSKGKSEKAGERKENETQRAAREKLELSQRAEEKYNEEHSGEDR